MQCTRMKRIMSAAEESYEGHPISMDLSESKGLFNLLSYLGISLGFILCWNPLLSSCKIFKRFSFFNLSYIIFFFFKRIILNSTSVNQPALAYIYYNLLFLIIHMYIFILIFYFRGMYHIFFFKFKTTMRSLHKWS